MAAAHHHDQPDDFARQAMPYVDVLYAAALRMTRNEKEAEDLVQDTMLRAFRFFEKFQQGTNLRAWLMKVMTNIFLNTLKKASKRPRMVEFEPIEELIGEVENEWVDVSSDRDDLREYLSEDVARALDDLPMEYRLPVILSAIDGLSYKEMGQVMQCPIGTVMSRLYRGRKILEEKLRPYAREIGFLKRGGHDEVH